VSPHASLADRRAHDDPRRGSRFAERDIAPISESLWEEQGFPYDVWRQAGELGFTGLPYPEAHGGGGGSWLSFVIVLEELARVDCAVANSLMANSSVASLLNNFGTEAQKETFLRPILDGSRIGSIALTEPNAGSDAGAIQTRATLVDGGWVINGAKIFISNSGTEVTGPVVLAACHRQEAGRPQRDLQHHRAQRNAGLQLRQEAEEDRLARVEHVRAVLRQLPRAGRQPARRARLGTAPDAVDDQHRAHPDRRIGRWASCRARSSARPPT
jgi:hypothetical protein